MDAVAVRAAYAEVRDLKKVGLMFHTDWRKVRAVVADMVPDDHRRRWWPPCDTITWRCGCGALSTADRCPAGHPAEWKGAA